MMYLGIDTSVNSMPFAVFEDKNLVDFGLLKIKGSYIEDKLNVGFNNIQELIDKYNIDVMVLEDVYHGKNFTSTKSTLQMIGALKLGAYQKNVPCFSVPATKWRKGVIKRSKRETMKQQAVNYVNEMYDLELKYHKSKTRTDDDMAEAILMLEGLVWKRYTIQEIRIFKDKIGDKHG